MIGGIKELSLFTWLLCLSRYAHTFIQVFLSFYLASHWIWNAQQSFNWLSKKSDALIGWIRSWRGEISATCNSNCGLNYSWRPPIETVRSSLSQVNWVDVALRCAASARASAAEIIPLLGVTAKQWYKQLSAQSFFYRKLLTEWDQKITQ